MEKSTKTFTCHECKYVGTAGSFWDVDSLSSHPMPVCQVCEDKRSDRDRDDRESWWDSLEGDHDGYLEP